MYFIFSVLLISCQSTLCKQIVIIFVKAPNMSGKWELVLRHADKHQGDWRVKRMGEHPSACTIRSGLTPCHQLATNSVPKLG